MENMCVKARAGRRIALMVKNLRLARSAEKPAEHAPSYAIQDLPQHHFLQRINLSEERFSRLKVQ